ncbi:MAG: 3-methylcrotonyl-CoA carboxylase, partial [Burkholderiaceae bacterium]|nr:3-methylcrotonyl-CoA carboxylase [Burkholderiaceae bacterium]
AVKAVQAIGYEGAGTLEFLLDAQGEFFFMEMNTRLQVEHPVTEAITGLDLVDWQLRIAAGEPLPLTQDQVCFAGHAIEVRLCAEDALHHFMPQSGTMAAWAMPGSLRVEHALRPGDEIPPYYDSMIAKLVAHGASRAEALRKLQRGLEDAVALGVTTNQAFLSRCLAHPVFGRGGATTAFIGEHQAGLLAGLTREGDAAGHRRAAALASLLLHLSGGERATAAPGLTHRMPMLQRFTLDGVACQGALSQRGPQHFATRLAGADDELELVAASRHGDAGRVRVRIGGLAESATWQRDGSTLRFHFAGRAWNVVDASRAAAAQAGDKRHHDGKLRASMNGRVVALLVAIGDEVSAGQPMLTLEAMKMEHVHTAPRAGRVSALHVGLGDQVASHRVVAEIEAPKAAEPAPA